jgi:hypothetical protein
VLVPMCGATSELSVPGMFTLLRTHHRRLLAGVLATAATAAVATPAVAGQSQTRTLRFFEHTTDVRLTTADGTPKSAGPPAAGDILDVQGVFYRGNHRHHARRPSGTDHSRCVFTGPDSGTCQGEVAIGGSLILDRSALGGNPFEVWYGTGRFKGITGSGTATSVGGEESNDSDVVLRYRIG